MTVLDLNQLVDNIKFGDILQMTRSDLISSMTVLPSQRICPEMFVATSLLLSHTLGYTLRYYWFQPPFLASHARF